MRLQTDIQASNVASAQTIQTPQKTVRVIAVTGGKGGVGKSTISVNLGVALASRGVKTYLFDADLGLGNVDVMLGIPTKYDLSHVIQGKKNLTDIIMEGPNGLKIIPAPSGIRNIASLSERSNAGLIEGFSQLQDAIDVMIVDTPAGIGDSVITFTRAAQEILIVICDEPTSIADAYALIKILSRDHKIHDIKILANMIDSHRCGRELFMKLLDVCDKFLSVRLHYVGDIPRDDAVRKAIQHQKPVTLYAPNSKAALAIEHLSEDLMHWPHVDSLSGQVTFFFERFLHQ